MNWQIQVTIFVGMALLTTVMCYIFPNASIDTEPGLIMWLPTETSDLEGKEVSISMVEAKTLPIDTTYLKMSYSPKFNFGSAPNWWDELSATLILSGKDRRSLHEPEICLDAQGWVIEKRNPLSIKTKGGDLEVMDLQLRRFVVVDGDYLLDENGERIPLYAHYLYWWVSRDGSTAHTDERVLQTVLDNFLRNQNSRWRYPSVMVHVDPRQNPQEGKKAALERAVSFIQEYAPRFQRSLGAELGNGVSEKGQRAPESLLK